MESIQRPIVEQEEGERKGYHRRFRQKAKGKGDDDHQVGCSSGGSDVANISPKGKGPEKGAQHPFPVCHPCDGLHVQRVQGEEGGDEGAAPEMTCHFFQGEKEQQSAGDVEKNIGEMGARRVQPIDLAVDHMRQPGQRVPVAHVIERKRPNEAFGRQALFDRGITRDIEWVVEVDEFEVLNLPVNQEGQDSQRNADQ